MRFPVLPQSDLPGRKWFLVYISHIGYCQEPPRSFSLVNIAGKACRTMCSSKATVNITVQWSDSSWAAAALWVRSPLTASVLTIPLTVLICRFSCSLIWERERLGYSSLKQLRMLIALWIDWIRFSMMFLPFLYICKNKQSTPIKRYSAIIHKESREKVFS